MADVPENTCSPDDPIMDAVELLDQAGNVVNTVRSSACNASWLCEALVALDVYPGVTALTWREWVPPPEPETPPAGE